MVDKYEHAMQLFEANKIALAVKAFDDVLKRDPNNTEATYKLGICQFRLKDFAHSERIFRTLIADQYGHYEAWYYLGLCLKRQDKDEEAATVFKIALAINPDFKAAKRKLGIQKPENRPGEAKATLDEMENGPGEELYSSKMRRMSSFTSHVVLLVFSAFGASLALTFFDFGIIYLLLIIFSLAFILALFDLIIRSRFYKYTIFEKRIDFKEGILFRNHNSLWLYEIKKLSFSQNPWMLITKNAKIKIEAENGNLVLIGLPSPKGSASRNPAKFMQLLFDELRNSVREQRGKVKKIWI